MLNIRYGPYNLKQVAAQNRFLGLIEMHYPQVLTSLYENVLPKVPLDLDLEEKYPIFVRYENNNWAIFTTLQPRQGSSLSRWDEPSELRDSLIKWVNSFNLNYHPASSSDLAASTMWIFTAACDTLAHWRKREPKPPLKWKNNRVLPNLVAVTEPFVFIHPGQLMSSRSNTEIDIDLLGEDPDELKEQTEIKRYYREVGNSFKNALDNYLERKSPRTTLIVDNSEDISQNELFIWLKDSIKNKQSLFDAPLAYQIQRAISGSVETSLSYEISLPPNLLDPIVFHHQGIESGIDDQQKKKARKEILQDFKVSFTERVNKSRRSVSPTNNNPFIATTAGWNPHLEPSRIKARRDILDEIERQLDNYLDSQENAANKIQTIITGLADQSYLRLLKILIEKRTLDDLIKEESQIRQETIQKSLREATRILGIDLDAPLSANEYKYLEEIFSKKSAVLFLGKERSGCRIQWINRSDIQFLRWYGFKTSLISRILRTLEQAYFQGYTLSSNELIALFSLEPIYWEEIRRELNRNTAFHVPIKPRKINPHQELRGVACIRYFLQGASLEDLSQDLWLDPFLWNWYWTGFLKTKLSLTTAGYPEELILGWSNLWNESNVPAEKVDRLAQLLKPYFKESPDAIRANSENAHLSLLAKTPNNSSIIIQLTDELSYPSISEIRNLLKAKNLELKDGLKLILFNK